MLPKLYKLKNVLAISGNYTATAAVVAGSLAMSQPWIMALGAALAGGVSLISLKKQKTFMEENLVRHPAVHKYSPQLGETVGELYKKSGLKSEEYPIYDFRVDENKAKKGLWNKIFKISLDQMAETHNAAALRLGKPVIMISEPLLKLLDTQEEKAVLAHEFAHAVARHQHVALPQRLLGAVAVLTNSVTRFAAFLSVGLTGIVAAIGASAVTSVAIRLASREREILSYDNSLLTLPEIAKKKKIMSLSSNAGSAVSVGVASLFNPAFLGIAVAVKGLAVGTGLISAFLSRSLEHQADTGAVELGADPLALMVALRKLDLVQKRSVEAAFEGKLPKSGKLTKIWKGLNVSHPSVDSRVKNLSGIARKNGVSAELIKQAATGTLDVPADNNMPYAVTRALIAGI